MGERVCYIPGTDLEQPLKRHSSRHARYFHLDGTKTESSKGHSIILSNHLLQHVGEQDNANDFNESGPTFCEVSFLNRSIAVWDAMVVDKVFCKCTDSNFIEALHSGKRNLYPECVSIPVKIKCCLFHDERGPI